ncbi:MAG: DUF5676 family membrane protein [Verrucomicrobia bacterium]|nr:DUF5676 family membrane protein [Verrucomicrobiota bacterium]
MTLNPKCLGLASGAAASLFYLGCILLMHASSPDALVVFFNSILHGLDIGPIMLSEVSWSLSLFGLVNTFVLSWLFGALVAVVYNLAARSPCHPGRA